MNVALIDMGSNSIRLAVYKVEQKDFEPIFSKRYMTGLASYVKEKQLTAAGVEQACTVLMDAKSLLEQLSVDQTTVFARMLMDAKSLLEQLSVDQTTVFATASLRNIKNTEAVVAAIQQKTGYTVQILSGHEEAFLDYFGVMHGAPMEEGALVDIGGGSTEITTFAADGPAFMESMPVGALRLHTEMVEKFLPKEAEAAQIQERVLREWKKIKADKLPHYDLLCAVGGTARAVLQLIQTQQAPLSDANSFTAEQFQKLKKQLLKRDEAAKKLILQVCPERVHTILPGILILDVIIRQLHTHLIYVSPYGVREGYLLRHYLS